MTTPHYRAETIESLKSATAFRKLVGSDLSLQAILMNATEDQILAEANRRGYKLTVRDLTSLVDPIEETVDISQEDLQCVAGGGRLFPSLIGSCDGCESGVSCGPICQTILGATEEPEVAMVAQAAALPKSVRSYRLRRRRG